MQSAKYGDIDEIRNVINLNDDSPIRSITVLRNRYLQGLRFTFENGLTQEFAGRNSNEENDGPVVENTVNLALGEYVVGITVEQDRERPRKIGFTILKTI